MPVITHNSLNAAAQPIESDSSIAVEESDLDKRREPVVSLLGEDVEPPQSIDLQVSLWFQLREIIFTFCLQ